MAMGKPAKRSFNECLNVLMFDAFSLLARNRALLIATTFQAIRARFVGNVFGAVWLLLYPILFLAMYSTIYVYVLGVRIQGLETADYVLTIFCGLVPFLAFSEAFGVGTSSIVANRGLLRNTLFPIELVVARDVIVGHATMGLGMLLVWCGVLYQGHLHWTHLAVLLIYVVQILMVLGIVWITASLTVFFRDLQQASPILILFLMLVSPIGYTDAMVPVALRPILLFNPLSWLMNLYRSCLLGGVLPLFDMTIVTVFSILIFMLGYRLISRLKPIFSDYV